MKEPNKRHTYTFPRKTGLWMLYICFTGYSQNFMMMENLDSRGFLIMELQDTSVRDWESSQYIVYQDNTGEIYTHPLADKDTDGVPQPASVSKPVIPKANKDMSRAENPEPAMKNEGAEGKGRRKKVRKVVPE